MDEPTPPDDRARRTATPTRSRWSNAAWLLSSLLLIVLVVGAWMRMNDERASVDLANAIVAGDRPAAPALPTTGIEGDGAPGLPGWYRSGAQGKQVANAPGAQILVVNWWASWCGPCQEEAPELRKLADDYAGKVTVVGLDPAFEDLETDAREFVRDHDLRFPILRAARADKDAWGVGGYPETFVVGVDGRVSAHVNGPIDPRELRALVERELDGPRT